MAHLPCRFLVLAALIVAAALLGGGIAPQHVSADTLFCWFCW